MAGPDNQGQVTGPGDWAGPWSLWGLSLCPGSADAGSTAAALHPPGSPAHPAQGLFWWSRQGGFKTGSPIWPPFGSWNSLCSRSPEAENQPQEMRKLRSERLISRGEFQAQGSDFDGYLWNRCCRVIHSDALSDQRLK
ncbi:unnamed protein product [Rangifer tarandus platyrhynchus]|uniref:Uncharacterized protein n=2 Tax=Rangifer tarandus platyrhynchus TaxID=3082113 RepID=A0ABN8ZN43_RANTA|nr:unnamed protein product [Rangifer tarandus platyrhynchus]